MTRVRQIQIPGTNLTMVDGNSDGKFTSNISCYKLKCDCYRCPGNSKPTKSCGFFLDDSGKKIVNTKADYYLVDSRSACPDDWEVIKILRDAGFADTIKNLDLSGGDVSFEVPSIENFALVGGKMDALKTMFDLNEKLKDSDQKVRYKAAVALVDLSEKVDWPTLFSIAIRELKESPYVDIRGWGAMSLGQPGTYIGYIKLLSEAYRNEKSDDVRNIIIWALGHVQNSITVETLEEALNEDPSPDVRITAINSLALLQTNELDAYNKNRSFNCVGPEIGLWDEIYQNFGVDSLLFTLKYDPDEDVRMNAAEKLGLFCSEKVTAGLIQSLLDEDENVFVQIRSALSLGMNADLPVVHGALLTAFFNGSRDTGFFGSDFFDPLVDAAEIILDKQIF